MAFETVHTDYVNDRVDLPPAADLVAMLDAGASYADIAADHGCSPSTVESRVSRSGLLQARKPTVEEAGADIRALFPVGDVAWMGRGLCAQTDPEEFYPEKGSTTRHAKAVCAVCPVQAECLDFALANNERFGIWGGLSERERRKVRAAMEAEHDTNNNHTEKEPA